ncbi:DNA cytosine methyltransferase [Rhizobium brockwellii]|uniref:DNA (cytosine-5-)-methyltransferase n=1 Tax=Rhizobium brockwellii TaxID=3019932 RepID=A0ABU3YHS3_9HYPH|nr:DNA cytosine methyltransferase [Rhizobium brockwellii]MDV4178401.1 DNA cytosine methyltransferase [Rhizobium brockwellii]MDV4185400.1 DNA cytosine methyltransferase [Rhizobium brockwellii]
MTDVRPIRQKLHRIRSGAKAPRVLDLFAGCGGFSLGFKRAGYDIAAAVEFDANAAQSHGDNFHIGEWQHAIARDITCTPPTKLAEELRMGDVSLAVDVLIGGPPCQAFARVGRSKLREIAEHPEAFRHDSRARLYIEYLRYVEAFAPLAVVMENVPDMLNHGGHNLAEEIAEVLEAKGYVCTYSLFNAAFYGVPQMRERMLLVAVHREVASDVALPAPTHWIELPQGYVGSRAVALKLLAAKTAGGGRHHYVDAPLPTPDLKGAITTREAIEDLPAIDALTLLKEGVLRRGRKAFDVAVPYNPATQSNYVNTMRSWPGYEGKSAVYDHVIRYLPRDYQIFAGLQPGDQYPEAHKYALKLFDERLAALASKSAKIEEDTEEWHALRASIVPPYDAGKFPNKWRKMEADQPARTLLAHLGKDGYSHIHYDSSQARPISVREAARLQSFPDGFSFAGTMNPAFRQIGNAVPPLLAWRVADTLRQQLTASMSDQDVSAFPIRSRLAT